MAVEQEERLCSEVETVRVWHTYIYIYERDQCSKSSGIHIYIYMYTTRFRTLVSLTECR